MLQTRITYSVLRYSLSNWMSRVVFWSSFHLRWECGPKSPHAAGPAADGLQRGQVAGEILLRWDPDSDVAIEARVH